MGYFSYWLYTKIEPTNVQLDSQLTASDQIIDLATGKSLTPQQLVEQLAQSPRVIVGEKHDNHYHHQIEQWLVQEMPKIRPQGAVLRNADTVTAKGESSTGTDAE